MCLAVTRQGFGSIYVFADKESAKMHPLIQYGDAVFGDERELVDEYRLLWLPSLLRRFVQGDELAVGLDTRVSGLREQGYTDRRVAEAIVADGTAKSIYHALKRAGSEPPIEAEIVLELVRIDRAAHYQENKTMAEAAKTKEPKASKAPKDDSIAGHPPLTRIKFGTAPDGKETVKAVKEVKDKDGKVTRVAVPASEKVVPGKPYNGTDNNPKTRGAGERFAKYKNNATLKSLVEAGCLPSDIKWDLAKGFIVLAT